MMRDFGAWVGEWPFRELPHRDLDGLEARLRREGIARTLVSPLDALFAGDPAAANRALAAQMAGRPFFRFAPLLNPSLPGVTRALERCRQEGDVAAIRLTPSYHGYAVEDDAVVELACFASIPLIVQMRMQDVRAMHPRAQIPDVSWESIVTLAHCAPDAVIVAAAPNAGEIHRLGEAFGELPNLWVTHSHVEGTIDPVARFVRRFGSSRLLFSTHAPLFTPTAARLKLETARIDEVDRRAIAEENCRHLLG